MSAEREAEEKARRQILARVGSWTERDTQRGETVGLLTLYAALDAYAATIAARVDAEWRARVEGARKQIESKAFIVVNDDPNHDGAVHECNYCVDAQAVTRSTEILAALLTAVARDREGEHG